MTTACRNKRQLLQMFSVRTGRRIWVLRFANFIKREELAQAINVPIDTLDDVEHLRIDPPKEVIAKICSYFEVPEDLLVVEG